MTTPDFRPAIRKALNFTPRFDLVALFRRFSRTSSRLQWTRLNRLRARCETGCVGTCGQLANEFHVTPKTINRDLAALRREGFVFHYNPTEWRYTVTHPHATKEAA